MPKKSKEERVLKKVKPSPAHDEDEDDDIDDWIDEEIARQLDKNN